MLPILYLLELRTKQDEYRFTSLSVKVWALTVRLV
jgi:hypothetical protein